MDDAGSPTSTGLVLTPSNQDGYFQVASLNPGAGNTTNVLDDSGGSMTRGNTIVQSAAGSSTEREWDFVSVGSGYSSIVNRLSGMALDMSGGVGALAGFAVQEPLSGTPTQQWQILPVH